MRSLFCVLYQTRVRLEFEFESKIAEESEFIRVGLQYYSSRVPTRPTLTTLVRVDNLPNDEKMGLVLLVLHLLHRTLS